MLTFFFFWLVKRFSAPCDVSRRFTWGNLIGFDGSSSWIILHLLAPAEIKETLTPFSLEFAKECTASKRWQRCFSVLPTKKLTWKERGILLQKGGSGVLQRLRIFVTTLHITKYLQSRTTQNNQERLQQSPFPLRHPYFPNQWQCKYWLQIQYHQEWSSVRIQLNSSLSTSHIYEWPRRETVRPLRQLRPLEDGQRVAAWQKKVLKYHLALNKKKPKLKIKSKFGLILVLTHCGASVRVSETTTLSCFTSLGWTCESSLCWIKKSTNA